jgi:hypothetical protein
MSIKNAAGSRRLIFKPYRLDDGVTDGLFFFVKSKETPKDCKIEAETAKPPMTPILSEEMSVNLGTGREQRTGHIRCPLVPWLGEE